MLSDNTLQAFSAFSTAAGLSATHLNLLVRTCLLSGFFMWAAWCALELMKQQKHHQSENLSNLLFHYIQLFFLVSVVIALVFIP